MNAIRHRETLVYYDGVQLFEGVDRIGGHYLCLLIHTDGSSEKYLTVGISPDRLRDFKAGEVELRKVILERELDGWFIAQSNGDLTQEIVLQPQAGTEIPEA